MRNVMNGKLAEVAKEEKEKGKKAVCIGDVNNTIIFVRADIDPDEARKDYIRKLTKSGSSVNMKDEKPSDPEDRIQENNSEKDEEDNIE